MDKKDKKERIIVPLICLFMSIGLWFYVSNVENTIRQYGLTKVPVEILNIETLKDSKLTLSPNQEFYIDLKLEGSNEIYKIKKEDFKITVDISEYALKKGGNKMAVNIIESPADLTIKNTNNLNIVVNLEEISEKTIEIKSEISVTPREGYSIAPIEIDNKDVKITGAASLVDKVEAVVIRGDVKDAVEDIIGSYDIIPIDSLGKKVEGVELKSKYADVVIKVSKVSKGRSIPIKINTVGKLPEDLKLKSIEGSRKTSEIVGAKALVDQVVELQTEKVDLSQVKDNGEVTVGIIVPEGATLLQGEEFITVKVNVVKLVSKDLEVKFSLKGVAEGLTVTPEKPTIIVKVKAFEDEIEAITADKIKAELNVEKFKEEGTFEGTPIIDLVGLNSTVSVTTTEKISFKVVKVAVPPVKVPPQA
ncbi:CdaR family protein [Clostridium gasigenes]|uniref:YbbR domain-containing protein n=1 Tax=Clostridium gasigenes TaxID=94869 RepID=A0A1H0SLT8_9CLOT|nr:CdaR family protein [Clostridium gasigenes]SDP42687.1 YbbR domain-containing protein [Clostridium gasigenes]